LLALKGGGRDLAGAGASREWKKREKKTSAQRALLMRTKIGVEA